MDIAEQIRRHLPRNSIDTVPLIDHYCRDYRCVFADVRNYESFKFLHLGIISDIKRKSLTQISQVFDISNQKLHHFLTCSTWSHNELEKTRLQSILSVFKDTPITVIIDETGDRKKGNKTDYVSRQYLGSIGKVDRGIVSVNAYGVYQNITFPLITRIFKPKGTLKTDDTYQTKIQIATDIIDQLIDYGFKIKLVLADSLYGESSDFIDKLIEHQLDFIVAIRNNHGVWMPSNQKVRANKWYEFIRVFSNGKKENRHIREIIYGVRKEITYWQITTDIETMPENSTSFVMTNVKGSRTEQKKTIGNLYGQRTWIEYGFRQCKQELGWTDYILRNSEDILKWWEIINSAYWMVSLNTKKISQLWKKEDISELKKGESISLLHPNFKNNNSWKSTLTNYRIMIQPIIVFGLLLPWLKLVNSEILCKGFNDLLIIANEGMSHFWTG